MGSQPRAATLGLHKELTIWSSPVRGARRCTIRTSANTGTGSAPTWDWPRCRGTTCGTLRRRSCSPKVSPSRVLPAGRYLYRLSVNCAEFHRRDARGSAPRRDRGIPDREKLAALGPPGSRSTLSETAKVDSAASTRVPFDWRWSSPKLPDTADSSCERSAS